MPTADRGTLAPLRLKIVGSEDELLVQVDRLIIAGFTGRDSEAVSAHIAELAEIGVPAPATTPTFYDLPAELLTTAPVISIEGGNTSGEVEPVLIRHANRFYLAVGSDHTDRDIERSDIGEAKGACPKPLGPDVIPLSGEPEGWKWDDFSMSSTVDGIPYQHGTLAALRTPADLLEKMVAELGAVSGDIVIYTGTLPLLTEHFSTGTRWEMRLRAGDGTTVNHSYDVKRSR